MSNFWMKLPLDLESRPDYSDLFDENPENFRLWIRIMIVCVRADDEGRLTHRQGKPLQLRHLAKLLDKTEVETVDFLELCRELDLVSIIDADDQPATIQNLKHGSAACHVTDWEEWWGDRRASSAERVRKWRKRQKEESETDETSCNVTCNTGETLHETGCNVTCNNDETHVTPLDQNRSDQEKSRSRKEQTSKEGLRLKNDLLACLFDKDLFLQECDQAHRFLTGKPFPKSSHKNTITAAEKLLSEFEWATRAGAVLLAAQQVQYEQQQGKKIANPWGYLIPMISDHMKEAEQYIRLAKIHGIEPEFYWEPKS